jgi:hypothetical protein
MRRRRCGVGWLGCRCGEIRWGEIVADFEDEEPGESIGGGLVGHQGGQTGEVVAGSVVVLADPEGVCESGLKGACGDEVQGWGSGAGGLQDDGEAGFAAVGAEDGAARDRCIGGQRECEGRTVSAIGGGDLIPEIYCLIVIGAGPVVGYLSRIFCGEGGLMTLEEDASGEEVILGAPGLEFFGGEGSFVGGVELVLAPLNQRQLD